MKKTMGILLTLSLVLSGLFGAGFPLQSTAQTTYATRLEGLNAIILTAGVPLPEDTAVIDGILSAYPDTAVLPFSDKQVLAYAVDKEYIFGYPDGTIKPNGSITRAEYAVMIKRCEEIITENEKLVDFDSSYTDIADWSRDGIVYCMERGIMMGYGDRFGSGDKLTGEQVDIVAKRFSEGLFDSEKYTTVVLNKTAGLKSQAVLATGSEAQLAARIEDAPEEYHEKTDAGWITFIYMVSSTEENVLPLERSKAESIIYHLEKYVNLHGTFDYANYPDLESQQMLCAQITQLSRYETDIGSILADIKNASLTFDEELAAIKNKVDNKVKSKSFFISTPSNVLEWEIGGGYPGSVFEVKGYEYFVYYQGERDGLPADIEVGKWYRREVHFSYLRQVSPSSGIAYLDIREDHSTPELVPDSLIMR